MAERFFLQIDKFLFDIRHVISVEKSETFESDEYNSGRFVYSIIVNKSEDPKVPYANTTIKYYNEKIRNKKHKELLETLIENGDVIVKKM